MKRLHRRTPRSRFPQRAWRPADERRLEESVKPGERKRFRTPSGVLIVEKPDSSLANRRERDWQWSCHKLLRDAGALVVQTVPWEHWYPEAGLKNPKYSREGFRKGLSDLLICFPGGVFAAIELKLVRGSAVSAEQRRFLSVVKALGGIGEVVSTREQLEGVIAMAKETGVRGRRRKAPGWR